MRKAVIGILDSRADAEVALYHLKNAGVPTDDVSVLFPDTSGTKDFAYEHNTKAPEGAVAGAGAGGVVGGTLGLLAGIGTLAIPGLGALIAAGPILGLLSGAAAGAAVGGVAGALVGMGIPELEAKRYEGKLRSGSILIAVHVETLERQRTAERVLRENGAKDVTMSSEASVPREARRTGT